MALAHVSCTATLMPIRYGTVLVSSRHGRQFFCSGDVFHSSLASLAKERCYFQHSESKELSQRANTVRRDYVVRRMATGWQRDWRKFGVFQPESSVWLNLSRKRAQRAVCVCSRIDGTGMESIASLL